LIAVPAGIVLGPEFIQEFDELPPGKDQAPFYDRGRFGQAALEAAK
jgi:hypothetical protein